jgi:hypothetical protein
VQYADFSSSVSSDSRSEIESEGDWFFYLKVKLIHKVAAFTQLTSFHARSKKTFEVGVFQPGSDCQAPKGQTLVAGRFGFPAEAFMLRRATLNQCGDG